MAESLALAAPEEVFAVLEEAIYSGDVDPVGVLLAQQQGGSSGGWVGDQQIEPVLYPVQPLNGDALASRQPVNPGDQESTCFTPVHPSRRPARGCDHSDTHVRIGIARFGVILGLEASSGRQQIE